MTKSVTGVKKQTNKPMAAKTKAATAATKPAAEQEKPKEEVSKNVIWYDLESLKKQRAEEEPFHILVYFRTIKQKNAILRHGRITFSKHLSGLIGENKKIKFGALDGKIVFEINDKEGFTTKLGSKMYTKRVISNCHIAEIIYDRFKLKEGHKSITFLLKKVGENFYLIDKIFS